MRSRIAVLAFAFFAALTAPAAAAPVVDATASESSFQKNDFKTARSGFDGALKTFLDKAPRDGTEHKVYAEAEYLLDRLADCSFTQRDWDRLKHYMDSQWRMVNQDITVCEQQFKGTVNSAGATRATAQYVADRLDESMRLRQIFQLKRSLALMLIDSGGSGPKADKAIRLYQKLALLMRQVLSVEEGSFHLDISKLNDHISEFESINAELPEKEMKPLWDKYKPAAAEKAPAADNKQKPQAQPKPKPKTQPKS
jgi:hypothetical protein